jgi:osomolarity two-component system response regulator SSK1
VPRSHLPYLLHLLNLAQSCENSILAPLGHSTRLPKRSVSMPPHRHLGHLQPPIHSTSGSVPLSVCDEISRELSDSVQAMVQTLLHLSPPHILDPVKELFSACTVQLPTPSVSALLTAMKNLNYLSANLKALAPQALSLTLHDTSLAKEGDVVSDNFDIGEVVQSVGDVLGGIAAQAGVDLAIFHGDVGMRHINVIGDERSILFILTHVRLPLCERTQCATLT